jgi:predicted RNA binding protein YcfA (HicA-like mRNA interferase family)
MSKPVTSQQLVGTLEDLGFKLDAEQAGAHLLLRHEKTGAVLTLPKSARPLRPVFVNTAARQVANSGIASVEAFSKRLEFAGQRLALGKVAGKSSGKGLAKARAGKGAALRATES